MSVDDHLEAAPVNDDQPLISTERLDAVTEANAAMAREYFAVFRRTIRPGHVVESVRRLDHARAAKIP